MSMPRHHITPLAGHTLMQNSLTSLTVHGGSGQSCDNQMSAMEAAR